MNFALNIITSVRAVRSELMLPKNYKIEGIFV